MKTKLLAATALVVSSFSPVFVTPAFAEIPAEVQDEIDDLCVAAVQPNENAGFFTEAKDVVETLGVEELVSSIVVSSTPGGVLLSQNSVFNAGSQHRHGGSPNIFGGFTVTSVYTGGSSVTENTYSVTNSYSFGCLVYKIVGNERLNDPPGQQYDGILEYNVSAGTRTETVTVNNPNETVVAAGDGVICNSPTKNPGTWRNQNGYTGTCSTALFYSLEGIADPIPSNSLPAA